CQQHNTYPTTF
nr:immunoglobulin light chain junction region [Macaca mulatta]MOV81454.1 immunoglobulin light chain junction region [Macaca mulatta]